MLAIDSPPMDARNCKVPKVPRSKMRNEFWYTMRRADTRMTTVFSPLDTIAAPKEFTKSSCSGRILSYMRRKRSCTTPCKPD